MRPLIMWSAVIGMVGLIPGHDTQPALDPHPVVEAQHIPIEEETDSTPQPVEVSEVAPVAPPPPPQPSTLSEKEQIATDIYRAEGFTDVAIAHLLGTIKQESQFDNTNKTGDKGTSWGLFQWRYERHAGMPEDYTGQVHWSLKDMQSDEIAKHHDVYHTMKTSTDVTVIRKAIKKWIRWSHEGRRWEFANQYMKEVS